MEITKGLEVQYCGDYERARGKIYYDVRVKVSEYEFETIRGMKTAMQV